MSSSDLARNLPMLATSAAGATLLPAKRTRGIGGIVVLVTGLFCSSWIFNYCSGQLTTTQWFGIAGAGLLVIAGVLASVCSMTRLRVDFTSLGWAVGALLAASAWVIGDWMPWTRTTEHLVRVANFSSADGQTTYPMMDKTLSQDCCAAFQNRGSWANWTDSAQMLLLLVLSVTLAFTWSRFRSGVGLIVLGLVYLSSTFDWLVSTSNSNMTGASLAGIVGQSTIERLQTTNATLDASVAGLPGGWIASIAAVSLVTLGVFRCLATTAAQKSSMVESRARFAPVPNG